MASSLHFLNRLVALFAQHPAVALLLFTALLYLPGSPVIPLMDRDEPRFARATVEMMNRSELVVPYFNNEYRFDKPPLTYWWMQIHYRLFGTNELAARLHSIVAVFLTSWIVFAMGRQLAGLSAAWFASLAWLTSLQVLVHGRLCVADMPMVLAVTLANGSLLWLLVDTGTERSKNADRWAVWALWTSLGLGFLAKGPIALLVPFTTCALLRWVFWRKPLPWSRLKPLLGSLGMLAIIAAWGIPALVSTRGAFWNVGMGEHIVERGTAVFNGRKFIPFYYFATAFLSLFPWIVFIRPILRFVRQNPSPQIAFLVSWTLAPHLIFFFYATQLPHYVMPAFPAFALLFGLTLHHAQVSNQPVSARGVWLLAGAFVALPLAVLLGLTRIHDLLPVQLIALLASLSLLLLLVFTGGALLALLWPKQHRFRIPLTLLWLALFGCQLHHTSSILRSTSISIQVSQFLGTNFNDQSKLLAWQFAEPSLVYYAAHPWKMSGGSVEKFQRYLNQKHLAGAVLLRREWTLSGAWRHWLANGTLRNASPDSDNSSVLDDSVSASTKWRAHTIQGFNAARSSWAEVIVLKPLQ